MLYLLTGDIESGKTSWLKRVVATLQARSVPLYGFISPAVFKEHGQTLEKVAIDCQLLPEKTVMRFGWRDDEADNRGGDQPSSLSASLHTSAIKLRWRFDDAVLCVLNHRLAIYDQEHPVPGLFIVDELGFLEFRSQEGVREALRIFDEGCYQDAIAVIRPSLLDEAYARWTSGAGGDGCVKIIQPSEMFSVAGVPYRVP
jgi:hypothetical protein